MPTVVTSSLHYFQFTKKAKPKIL